MKYGRPWFQITGRRNTLRWVTTSSGSPHLAATSERVLPSLMSLVPHRMEANDGPVNSRASPRIAAPRFMAETIGPSALTGNEWIPVARSAAGAGTNLSAVRGHSKTWRPRGYGWQWL